MRALSDLFDEIPPETPEEVDSVLREAGFDPKKVAAEMKDLAEKVLRQSPLDWRNQGPELEAEKKHVAKFSIRIPQTRDELMEAIGKAISSVKGQEFEVMRVHHRDFENATDEDLASLLRELEYLATKKAAPSDKIESAE